MIHAAFLIPAGLIFRQISIVIFAVESQPLPLVGG
jgi:hypothetical protein